MITQRVDDLRGVFGFGVAGNFAGHLEQAGEAGDFVTVAAAADAPKGIFPWYVPGAGRAGDADAGLAPEFLAAFPVSAQAIALPENYDNLQIEPEVGLLAAVSYRPDGTVAGLRPVSVGAFNDCSIRRPGARKISEKKNWGPASKGMAEHVFAIDDLSADGPTAAFRLVSFLVREGQTHAYGVDSAVPDYSYYGTRLVEWIITCLTEQTGAPDTPLEPVGAYLRQAGNPERVLIGIGATRYTAVGERTYLQTGDDSVVVVYDSGVHAPEDVAAAVADGAEDQLTAASVLRQRVTAVAAAAVI